MIFIHYYGLCDYIPHGYIISHYTVAHGICILFVVTTIINFFCSVPLVVSLLLKHTFTGCENITVNCSRGSQCKVDEAVHQAYCEPLCGLDNGGCNDNEVCSLQQQNCTNGPCPPVVKCLGESKCSITKISHH